MSDAYLTVSQINRYIKQNLERDSLLSGFHVLGEIANIRESGGHAYFSITDGNSSLRCIMFASQLSQVSFPIETGMAVLSFGRMSLYEKTGHMQFYAQSMENIGAGAKEMALQALREKLRAEGLFDLSRKKPLPFYPRHIGVLTSPTGSVIQDILQVGKRRNPHVIITVLPIKVQGEHAEEELIHTLEKAYKSTFDLLIIARGGGSQEDLEAFQTEGVVRAIAKSPIPIISAVGHETDTTLADLVADLRAATPSEAAELAIREKESLVNLIYQGMDALQETMEKKFSFYQEKLEGISYIHQRDKIIWLLNKEGKDMYQVIEMIEKEMKQRVVLNHQGVMEKIISLEQLSPLSVLQRGFTYMIQNDTWIQSVKELDMNQGARVVFADGEIMVEIKSKTEKGG